MLPEITFMDAKLLMLMRATQRAGSTEVMLATTVDITLDPIPMLVKLVLTILVPALAGMVHRVFGNSQYNST